MPPRKTTDALRQAVATARAQWAELEVDEGAFLAALAELPDLDEARIPDLLLAFAATAGDPRAIAAFDRLYTPVVRQTARRIDRSSAFVDEVEQRIRIRFLVGEGSVGPRLAQYDGRGPLKNWVIGATLWLAKDMKRAEGKPDSASDDELDLSALPAGSIAARRSGLGRKDRAMVGAALASALDALEPRDRTVLRMYFVDGLSLDGIGQLYGVNRSTVSRWLSRSRAVLLERVLDHARRHLGLKEVALKSMVRSLEDDFELGLSRILASRITVER